MPTKTKTPQSENLDEAQGRDLFQTPNYAVDLLVDFLNEIRQMSPTKDFIIWECAAGQRKISNRLKHWGFEVVSTDIQDESSFNFLTDIPNFKFDCIVTNTPFSLKKKFWEKCVSYDVPTALLLPTDYSGWIINAIKTQMAEKIIPERRIDYITPNILQRIWDGETWEKCEFIGYNLKEFKEKYPEDWNYILQQNMEFKYDSIYDVPSKLLRKYSSSDFHSMWMTRHLNLGQTETFVELTNEMKDNI